LILGGSLFLASSAQAQPAWGKGLHGTWQSSIPLPGGPAQLTVRISSDGTYSSSTRHSNGFVVSDAGRWYIDVDNRVIMTSDVYPVMNIFVVRDLTAKGFTAYSTAGSARFTRVR
jgi:hypothetical protein